MITNKELVESLNQLDEDDDFAYGFEENFIERASQGMGIRCSLGWITHVENGIYLDDFGDKCQFVVIKVGDQYFRNDTAYNSWTGTDWEYVDFKEVVQRQVTRYEYLPKSEGDQIE